MDNQMRERASCQSNRFRLSRNSVPWMHCLLELVQSARTAWMAAMSEGIGWPETRRRWCMEVADAMDGIGRGHSSCEKNVRAGTETGFAKEKQSTSSYSLSKEIWNACRAPVLT